MDRRTFLVLAAAAVGTTGCTSPTPVPGPSSKAPIRPDDPDSALRQRVAQSEVALLASYRAALAEDPSLAPTLEPIMRQHEDHLARVSRSADPSAAVTPSAVAPAPTETTSPAPASGASGSEATTGAPSAPTSGSPATTLPTASPSPERVLVELSATESAARDQRIAACDAAVDPALARVLCLIGASEAQHAAALNRARREAQR